MFRVLKSLLEFEQAALHYDLAAQIKETILGDYFKTINTWLTNKRTDRVTDWLFQCVYMTGFANNDVALLYDQVGNMLLKVKLLLKKL